MPKAIIFLADSNLAGISNKSIAPTIKLLYIKAGWDCRIINLYTCDFDPLQTSGLIYDAYSKSFYHEILGSQHIHILTHEKLGGYSSAFEGFIETMFKPEYIKESWKNKDLFIHVNHISKSPIFKTINRFRFTTGLIRSTFNSVKIFSSDLSWSDKDIKIKKLNNLKKTLTKCM